MNVKRFKRKTTVSEREAMGECGDCGQPIYKDGKHNSLCIKPSETPPKWMDSNNDYPITLPIFDKEKK